MVYKCSASGCKSGYDGRPKDASVTFHSFPLKSRELVEKWKVAVKKPSFNVSKYSRLCSLHFQQEDFVNESCDTNITRRRTMGSKKLQLRRLKKDAYPTVMLPSPLKKHTTPIKIKEEPSDQTMEIHFFDSDSPNSNETLNDTSKRSSDDSMTEMSLSNMSALLQSESPTPNGFQLISLRTTTESPEESVSETTLGDVTELLRTKFYPPPNFQMISLKDQLVIFTLIFKDGIPYISSSLTVTSDLTPIVSIHGTMVERDSFRDVVKGKINKAEEVVKLLGRMTDLMSCPTP